jgi:5-methylcytosine-specific restriction endonuclease McrBC regulatory subunit McrC
MENIRRNSLHKERFAVEYDEFTEDIPENRLIKIYSLEAQCYQ